MNICAYVNFYGGYLLDRIKFWVYNIVNYKTQKEISEMIKTVAKPSQRKVTGCGECRSTCQSACKTSCTVGNQSCERITREQNPEKVK